jgi:hypothetical protein
MDRAGRETAIIADAPARGAQAGFAARAQAPTPGLRENAGGRKSRFQRINACRAFNGATVQGRGLMATIRFTYRTPDIAGGRKLPEPPAANDTVPPPTDDLRPVKADRWWRESSYDLWHGLEVREDAPDTIPAEWLDEFDLP